MLEAQDVSKVAKKEICALFFGGYNTLVDSNKYSKLDLGKMLREEIQNNGMGKLELLCNTDDENTTDTLQDMGMLPTLSEAAVVNISEHCQIQELDIGIDVLNG